jgi:hypothetical protein
VWVGAAPGITTAKHLPRRIVSGLLLLLLILLVVFAIGGGILLSKLLWLERAKAIVSLVPKIGVSRANAHTA